MTYYLAFIRLSFYSNTRMPYLRKGRMLSMLLFYHSCINYIFVNLKLSSFLYYPEGDKLALVSFTLNGSPKVRYVSVSTC